MPVAAILAIIQGASAAAPWIVDLVKSLQGKETVTAAELQVLLDKARSVHNRIQDA